MKKAAQPCRIEHTSADVLTLRFTGIRAGWQQWFLLTSDRHTDSTLSDVALQKRHLDEAMARDALVLDFGDCMDVMQSPQDKRQSKSELDAGDKSTAYLDSVVKRLAALYAPYAHRWPLLAMGNHESAILGRFGTNLTDRLAEQMRGSGGITIAGGYQGWVRLMFERTAGTGGRQSFALFFHHGSGGASPMTHGVLDTRRMASFVDADVIVAGHTHTNYHVGLMRQRLSDSGRPYTDIQDHVRTPGYKKRGGWEIEKGHPPKPLGAVWMRFYCDGRHVVRREFTMSLH